MFTGIITDIGEVTQTRDLPQGRRFRIATAYDPATIDIGASIACSGVCLTVVALPEQGANARWFEVEAWEEALRLTTAGAWAPGARLNLERALKAGDEYGGHMVSGHVDATATVAETKPEGDATRFVIEAPHDLMRFIAPKGSVALDGTSLTVNGVGRDRFDVLLIRHSLDVTTWGARRAGDRINLEIDPIARYVAHYADRLAAAEKEA
ncbi:MAG: riboflavin synthase [Roseitalea sp.]|jgi:riboflavin synthase|nr:riboflavin synthase [Roseitalea sp.]MBO6722818.1 riboflavin synthase [Roseitalea sp.]MBO6743988.1 riboflavin synthase [Roseitalea sp.]